MRRIVKNIAVSLLCICMMTVSVQIYGEEIRNTSNLAQSETLGDTEASEELSNDDKENSNSESNDRDSKTKIEVDVDGKNVTVTVRNLAEKYREYQKYRMIFFGVVTKEDETFRIDIGYSQWDQEEFLTLFNNRKKDSGYLLEYLAKEVDFDLWGQLSNNKWEYITTGSQKSNKESDVGYTDFVVSKEDVPASEQSKLYFLLKDSQTSEKRTLILREWIAKELYGIELEREDDGFLIREDNGLMGTEPSMFQFQKEDNDSSEEQVILKKIANVRRNTTEDGNGEELKEIETETPVPTEKADVTPTEVPEETPTAMPEVTPTEVPEETPTAMPEVTPTEVPEETPTVMPEVTPTEIPKETLTVTPEVTPTETPIITPSETPKPDVTNANGMTGAEEITPSPSGTEGGGKDVKADSEKREHLLGIFEGMRGGHMLLVLFLLVLIFVMLFVNRKNQSKKRIAKRVDPKSRDDEMTLNYPDEDANSEPTYLIQSAVVNNKGRIRGNNEDNFYLNGSYMHRGKMDDGAAISCTCEDDEQVYAVCDGMGGTDCGEEASYRAVKELSVRRKNNHLLLKPKELSQTMQEISDRIYGEAVEKGRKSGTTIVLVQMKAGRLLMTNIGDSRIYRFRNQKLVQISRDHSRVQRMVSMGLLTPEQARKDPARHVITQYLGMSNEVKLSPYVLADQDIKSGDLYLLCSDGLSDMVEDDQIADILKKNVKPLDAANALLKQALENGGKDNVTIMILQITGKDEKGEKGKLLQFVKKHGYTAAQMATGAGILAVLLDYICYLF